MPTTIKVDDKEFMELLKKHEAFVDKSMPTLVRKYARICCVELANRTQPFSVGSGGGKAKDVGEEAVKKGVTTALPDKGFFQFITNETTSDRLRERLQGMIAGGKWRQFADVMISLGMWREANVVSRAQMPPTHQDQRSKNSGRAYSLPGKINISSSSVGPYIKQMQKRVGMSKAGWADCARQIGGLKGDGARGIPAFAKAKRHKTSGEVRDRSTDKTNPRFEMTNSIPWISRICPSREQAAAGSIARDKMIKEANKALNAAAKNQFEEIDPS